MLAIGLLCNLFGSFLCQGVCVLLGFVSVFLGELTELDWGTLRNFAHEIFFQAVFGCLFGFGPEPVAG